MSVTVSVADSRCTGAPANTQHSLACASLEATGDIRHHQQVRAHSDTLSHVEGGPRSFMAEPGLSARYAREVSEKASTCSSLRTAAASAVVRQWRDQIPQGDASRLPCSCQRSQNAIPLHCGCLLQMSVADFCCTCRKANTSHANQTLYDEPP